MGIGYWCFNGSQKLNCQYQLFTGREVGSAYLRPGNDLIFIYEVEVQRGDLAVRIVAPNKTILWDSLFAESSKGDVSIQVDQGGIHQVVVDGHGTRGGFLIEWSIQ
jgi:hypothetical protein